MPNKDRIIYIASDHGGFGLKNFLADGLSALGYNIQDLGPKTYDPTDDYPDYIKTVGEKLRNGGGKGAGIVICRNGVGVSIVANKYQNVRCALSWNVKHIKSARNDDDVNVLALPADYVDNQIALEITLAFLETPAGNEERHIRRRAKIPR